MRTLCTLALVSLVTSALVAQPTEVHIELASEPIDLQADSGPALRSASSGGIFSLQPRIDVPSSEQLVVPFYSVNLLEQADSTLWAVRDHNQSLESNTTLSVEYVGQFNEVEVTEEYELANRQVQSRNVRDVDGLLMDLDGFSRGYIRFTSDALISGDFFQLDISNDFATGGNLLSIGEFCRNWTARFLRFDVDSGTVLNFMVDSPKGLEGDPSVFGNAYDEAGEFLNSFTIRTDAWVFQQDAHDLVLGTDFGTLEIVIDGFFPPYGYVDVAHPALGKFSVGTPAICTDQE